MPSLKTARPVNELLTEIAVEFANADDSYIANKVCPTVNVDQETGTYYTFTLDSFFGDANEAGNNLLRAPQAEYTRGGWDLSTGSYSCKEYGYEDVIDQRIAAGLDKYFDTEARCVKSATEKVLISQEIRVATVMQGTAWTGYDDDAGDTWDIAAGKPVDDIDKAMKGILNATGKRANTIAMGFAEWQAMRKNAQVTALLSADERSALTVRDLAPIFADMFGINQILVGSSVKNTGKLGKDASLAGVWSATDTVWVGWVNPDASKEDPSAAYSFTFEDIAAFSYDEDAIRSSIVRVNQTVAEATVALGLGARIKNVLA
jgi:hypothetical protein